MLKQKRWKVPPYQQNLSSVALPIFLTLTLVALPALSLESDTINSVQYKRVPGFPSQGININGISRSGDLIIFDAAGEGGDYSQIEGNCRKGQWRIIRMGGLTTRSSLTKWVVEFTTFSRTHPNYQWINLSGGHKKILTFACQLKSVLIPASYSPRTLGNPSYYRFRYEDFVRRNPGKKPPDYYLEFGEKYVTKFLNETLQNLTPQGQRFLNLVAIALQKKIEDKLSIDPQGFAKLEQDSSAFRKFAYKTHPDAYCESGWGRLPKFDRDKIIEAVDRRDLYLSTQGIITGAQLANRCGRFRDAIP